MYTMCRAWNIHYFLWFVQQPCEAIGQVLFMFYVYRNQNCEKLNDLTKVTELNNDKEGETRTSDSVHTVLSTTIVTIKLLKDSRRL